MKPISQADPSREDLIAAKLVDEIYERLRGYAALCVRTEHQSQTPTSIVHDALIRIGNERRFEGPEHLFACAAVAIRHTLVDRARRRNTHKRGGVWNQTLLDEVTRDDPQIDAAILELDGALEQLAQVDPRAAKVVELRFFGGLTLDDVAELLDISRKTASEDWAFARAWLSRKLGAPTETPP
ncbi:MAG: sigma-70 family RNA polymerase sigma factor [Phycisphaerales bacterium]|nr:sigma-70 family RNA polymerase sigma factor [Phycisphaerales bacterium]